MRVVTCTSLLVVQLLVLIVCSITTTDGIGTTVCPPGSAAAGPTSLLYSVYDDTQNSWYPSAVVLTDPISVLGCCGFVIGFTLVVNGDTSNGACESGCQIDFVIWKDIVDNTATSGKYEATVHGVINDITVTTDASWTGGAQSVPYTYYLPQSQWIALDPGVNYYPGWNGETYTAVDYIIQYSTECSDANVHCTPANNYYTTESTNAGFTQGSLSPGDAKDAFDLGTSDRFFAFQVIVEAGTPPSFVSPGKTMYVEPSLTVGANIVTATATNPETFETLTYGKAAETPTTVSCFDVDTTTGAITNAVDLSTTCLGQHNVTVRVSDGCMFALTTYTFIVATTTTTASGVTAAATAGSAAAATAAGSLVTTSGGTGTSTSTTAAATTTTVTTTTTAPTTTPSLFDTTTGKIIIGMIAGLALLLVGAAIGLCVVLSKNSAAAGSINQVTEATPGQTTYPTSFSDGFKQPPPAIDDDYSHMLKMKSKQRYLNSEKKAWDWT